MIDSKGPCVIGIDVGGTKISGCIIDEEGHLLHQKMESVAHKPGKPCCTH